MFIKNTLSRFRLRYTADGQRVLAAPAADHVVARLAEGCLRCECTQSSNTVTVQIWKHLNNGFLLGDFLLSLSTVNNTCHHIINSHGFCYFVQVGCSSWADELQYLQIPGS